MTWADEIRAERAFNKRIFDALNAAIKSPDVQTADEAAKAAYEALKPLVQAYGQNPETELFWKTSEEAKAYGHSSAYVSWEAGPYQWACFDFVTQRLAEPHYSFDLVFYNGE